MLLSEIVIKKQDTINIMYIIFIIIIIDYLFLRQWVKDSYEFYDTLRKMDDASRAGVTDISGYIFANSSPEVVKVRLTKK